jgi:anthranilate phosphoribosyltransferase
MDSIRELISLLREKKNLDPNQIRFGVDQLVSDKVDFSDKENFLTCLAIKGETIEEIASFTSYFQEIALDPELESVSEDAVDLCGTGGDKAGSFNISTFVSFLVASSGIPVIKHGNRSISSKCGSADLIEAIGIPLEVDGQQRREAIKALNYSFLFAPAFHPAFKHIAPVRKELASKGIISIFNILGPMINPARPGYQLLGVYSKELVSKISDSLHYSGTKGGFVVHCAIEGHPSIKGVDELTSCGKNIVQGFGMHSASNKIVTPAEFGFQPTPVEDIAGGNMEQNLALMNQLLADEAPEGLTQSVLMNASLAFFATGRTNGFVEGVELAKKLLKDGVVKNWLSKITQFFR